MHPAEAALAELAQGAVDGARRDELEAHLETCASCRDVLASVLSALSHEERAQPVGRFGSLEPIGVGAMGEVFSARDSVLERAVALKWLYPAMPGAEGGQLRQRLLAEARALAKVQHPNVVSVFDVIEWGRTHVIVMELVRGGSLRAWLAQPHDWREVVRVFTGAGEGLAAVHAAGLVHRDFKPDNVLLDEHGTARVSDFGLVGADARAGPFSDASLTGARLTRTSALRGTPVYMSPELFAGEPGTAASDQFAFCASLYEALIGQRPFQGTTLAELARAAATGDTLEPRGFPRWLVQLLRRGLAADPAKRFASMRELLDTLVEAPRRRRRWQLGLGATALLALAVAARGALAPDPCADGPARLAKVWPAGAGADLPSELRVWLDDSARRWNETWNHECGHGTEAEWRRTRGCLEAALDDLESVSAAARAGGPSKPASVLAQYVARPAACVNADNPARSALPAAPDARSKVVDALAALIDVAQLEAKEDLEGADARAAEAVSLASSHAPTRARALLARSRFQFNLGHAPEALESVAQAKQLAQSSGALREIARADLEAAFEPCALGRNAECASVLDRVAVMATALDDPYLRTLIEELRVSSDWKNPATSATLAGIVEQWKALPGTSAEVERSRGMYVTKLNNDGEFEKALMVTRDTLPEGQAPDSFAGCVALHARGRALAGLGRIDEALASYLVLEEAITRLGLTQMRTIVTHDRTMLLIERGRSEEALASLPAGVQVPLLFVVRALAQLELGRFDDARKSIDTLSAPFVFEGLTEYLKHRVRLLQVSLALATQDVATLSLALTWLEPTDEPLLRASVLSTLGRDAEAVAFLREQPETVWMSRIELAQREGRWADALALIEPHEKNTPSDRAVELSLRRAYTDVMLKQPEACARLEALRTTGKHRFALFPDERKRLDAAVKPYCR